MRATRHTLKRELQRRGFTLLEMMLVLAVLVTALALVYPAINRLYRDQQLQKAVELVQVRLAAARVQAVEQNVPYQFRFEPDGRRFIVIPEPEVTDSVDRKSAAAAQDRYRFSGELPTGLKFDRGEWAATAANQVPADWFQGLPEAKDLAGTTWTQPVVFYPDGTSTGGNIVVFDQRNFHVRFSVRPVTGGVTVSPIEGSTR